MQNDLRSKLEMYKKNTPQNEPSQKREKIDMPDFPGSTALSNGNGSFLLIEDRFPLSYIHGGYPLGKSLGIDMHPLLKLCGSHDCSPGIRDFLFLDTETTGLSGGAGTVAFLIGTGCFEEDFFVLRQFFMRDYDEEPAVLTALNELFDSHKGLVTFNGKAFDWNLLQTRFISNRIRPGLKNPVHLDLLFPSRSIWKLKLESCRLSSLEENVLGEYRADDIPGAMIPSIYFKYLEDRDTSVVKKVIKHNESDILSMVSLMLKINSLLADPLAQAEDGHELLGIGGIFEKNGEHQSVLECYNACISSDSFTIKGTASKRLAFIHKKNGDYRKSADLMELMLQCSKVPDMTIMIELAKYYEHKEKNIEKALDITERAIETSLATGLKNSPNHQQLKLRMDRLKRKISRYSAF